MDLFFGVQFTNNYPNIQISRTEITEPAVAAYGEKQITETMRKSQKPCGMFPFALVVTRTPLPS